jgi:hypothetical protein
MSDGIGGALLDLLYSLGLDTGLVEELHGPRVRVSPRSLPPGPPTLTSSPAVRGS